ncbi:hypothetical protein QCD71_12255 [Sphingomonas sp. PsM26]|nr:hypothetical protein [Sphingomonas sp. PsM26]
MHTDPQTYMDRQRYAGLKLAEERQRYIALGHRPLQHAAAPKLSARPCPVEEDPDFRVLDRATKTIAIILVVYMVLQFIRAWVGGLL